MAEIIDIYDANLQHQGTMERVEAHMNGQWHQTFHCWVINGNVEDGAVLFQLRSAEMVSFPNMLDVSAAGHLEAGEQVENGIREVSEELGIPITINDMHSLGYRVEVADQSNGQHNREYQAVYIARVDLPLSEYKPQVEEITGLVWVNIKDGMALFTKAAKQISIQGIRYDPETEVWNPVALTVAEKDFLPRIQQYYLTICIMAERLLENRFPIAIS